MAANVSDRNSDRFECNTGFCFHERKLLETALTHSSYAFEKNKPQYSNERLEFLGDAVLELAVSDYFFKNFSGMNEGEMTRRRAIAVCERSLADAAKEAGLGELIMLGRGEAAHGGNKRASILSDAFEAVIGALYLDQGFETAKKFVVKYLTDAMDNGDNFHDYKSELQEYVQNTLGLTSYAINYAVISAEGPDHDKTYTISLVIDGKKRGTGTGRSKKAAEQQAARAALNTLKQAG